MLRAGLTLRPVTLPRDDVCPRATLTGSQWLLLHQGMTTDESLVTFGLVPADEHLPEIRRLLAHEAAIERSRNGEREEDLALLCCVQLFSRGFLEDVLCIWDAKCAGFDLGSYLDIELLCGAGLVQTKAYLRGAGRAEAVRALAAIEDAERSGRFADFSPGTYLSQQRAYFRA